MVSGAPEDESRATLWGKSCGVLRGAIRFGASPDRGGLQGPNCPQSPSVVTVSAPSGATGAPTTVFVCYSRGDRERALPVIAALEAGGFSVWWDGLLQPGERFANTTAAALDSALAVVVLWSATSVASHWVHDEATRGRDRRVLVPLSLDGTPAPLGFGQFQTIDISRAKHQCPLLPVRLNGHESALYRPIQVYRSV